MLVLEYKVRANKSQQAKIDEAIRATQFIRNKALRLWMDTRGVSQYDMNRLCAQLAQESPFAAKLDAQARQAAAERAWQAVSRFYKNCREKKPGKKGYPRFQKDNRSVEYKGCGWKLEPDGQHIRLTDRHGIGTLRLMGASPTRKKARPIATFPIGQIKRVRLVKWADGYYCQFAVHAERQIDHQPTDHAVGIDVGLKMFYTDSDGNMVKNPRFLRQAEKKLKRLHRRVSRKVKRSKNRKKAIKRLAKGYLKASRQRKDFAVKAARALVQSHDLVAYEDLRIANMVKNHRLAKSISDASWGLFLTWVRYYGHVSGVPVVGVPAKFTTQECSGVLPNGKPCRERIWKSLSMRTHMCPRCGLVLDRDENAAKNILAAGWWMLAAKDRTAGQVETGRAPARRNASGQTTSSGRVRARSAKPAE